MTSLEKINPFWWGFGAGYIVSGVKEKNTVLDSLAWGLAGGVIATSIAEQRNPFPPFTTEGRALPPDTKNPIYQKFQKVSSWIDKLYGAGRGQQLQALSNDELSDLYEFMFTYMDLEHQGAGQKTPPKDLLDRITPIAKTYHLFGF